MLEHTSPDPASALDYSSIELRFTTSAPSRLPKPHSDRCRSSSISIASDFRCSIFTSTSNQPPVHFGVKLSGTYFSSMYLHIAAARFFFFGIEEEER